MTDRQDARRSLLTLAGGTLVLACLPFVLNDQYLIHLLILSMIYAMLAASWNLINGYAGVVSFGHQAFFGLGAYGSALLAMNAGLSPWLTLWFGGALAGVAGLVIGLPVLRIRSIAHVAVVTLAFAVIVHALASNLTDLTRGSLGLAGIPALPSFGPAGMQARVFEYYVAVALLAATFAALIWLVHSRAGLALRALRDSEEAADSVGINLTFYKLAAFLISSFSAGVTGAFYAHYVQVLTPESAIGVPIMVTILVITLVGGIGTVMGPYFAAFLITIGLEMLRYLGDYRLIVYGMLLIVFVIFIPEGLARLGLFRGAPRPKS
jgi:branched-chain amino acid transport system permease protein